VLAVLATICATICMPMMHAQAATSPSGTARPTSAGFGVTMEGLPSALNGLQNLSSTLGVTPGVAMWYEQWSSAAPFPAAEASALTSLGITPEITWEPWSPTGGLHQPGYSLASIASGRHDAYLLSWADEIKAWGGVLKLRFAHEMNGNWYPWDQGVNGNGPGSYVAAWRHIHDLFKKAGATKVIWVWSPNVEYRGSTAFSALWPGSSYVNEVALDGYNWGAVHPETGWQSLSEIFLPSVRAITSLTDLPLYLGEVSSTETGGNKARWISDMFATLAHWPEIKGFTWFDWDKETNWPIASSAQSLDAFRDGIQRYHTASP
jgi:hypothetical protein